MRFEAYSFGSIRIDGVTYDHDLIIDGGPAYPDPSSIIDLTGDTPEILRIGKGDISLFR